MAQVHAVADGLPLALVFSAAWLSEVSVTTFLQEWQRSRTALLSLPGFDSPDRASSLEVSVSLSFDTLKTSSRQVLHALSLHSAGVTTELLGKILPDGVALVPSTAELVRKSLVEKAGSHLCVFAPILRAYENALEVWSRQSRPDREAVCHLRIGDVLRLMGWYDDAAEHYLIGFRLHEELGENSLARGDATECLADVARITGDWRRAITLYTDAQRAFRSVQDGLVGMTNTAHSLGETRLALQDVDGARIDYDMALRTSQRIGDLQGAGQCSAWARQDRSDARGLFRALLSAQQGLGEPSTIDRSSTRLGQSARDAGSRRVRRTYPT